MSRPTVQMQEYTWKSAPFDTELKGSQSLLIIRWSAVAGRCQEQVGPTARYDPRARSQGNPEPCRTCCSILLLLTSTVLSSTQADMAIFVSSKLFLLPFFMLGPSQ
ncbi:hypothetical protein LIA77_00721 [Sarocladium implicatum]|nr:hypothetical protein LIA77_00721 [Sarocladium implicatum]